MFGRLIAIAITLVRLVAVFVAAWVLGGILGDQLRELRRGRAGDDELWRRSDEALNHAGDVAARYHAKPAAN